MSLRNNMTDSLVIGAGEVGKSLYEVLEARTLYNVAITDIKLTTFNFTLKKNFHAIHICFGYSGSFIKNVVKYVSKTEAKIVVIHSTVPVGTTDQIQKLLNILNEGEQNVNVIVAHSPVRGQHPNLALSLVTFIKYVGVKTQREFNTVRKELAGIPCRWINDPKATELGKMLSTSYYGLIISWHREMKKICDKFGVDFNDTVTDFNETYNSGYRMLRPEVVRPVLTPPKGKIGGHCVTQNAKILDKQIPSNFLKLIK